MSRRQGLPQEDVPVRQLLEEILVRATGTREARVLPRQPSGRGEINAQRIFIARTKRFTGPAVFQMLE